jgi:opacity protein-like surface antigen
VRRRLSKYRGSPREVGNRRRIAALGALALHWLIASVSAAEGPNVWDGTYLGPQLGAATNRGCGRWLLSGTGMNDTGQMVSQTCGSGSVVGGVVVGENFQHEHVFWGISGDIDFATAKKAIHPWTSNGPNPPAGTYLDSERVSPDGFIVLAPRIGYAGREWAPYLRAGALVALGGRDSAIAYTPSGARQSTAAFNGGRSFDTIGWAAGGGVEWGLYGPWSIGFEYMHANLGKESSSSARCAGTTAACEEFPGTWEYVHGGTAFDTYRVSLKYYFGFW